MSLRIFPSRSRKFVRLALKQTYESLTYIMREDLGVEEIQSEEEKPSYVKAKLGGAFGATVNVCILPEDGASTLEFTFSYRNLLYIAFMVLVAVIGLGLIWNTPIPMVGFVLLIPLAYKVNSATCRFLNTMSETLPHLEQEYARMALMEDRKRWQLEPKDTKGLYARLCEKHIRTWGNTHALEYKIAEYERQGLTHDEAIRKAADEEGIF